MLLKEQRLALCLTAQGAMCFDCVSTARGAGGAVKRPAFRTSLRGQRKAKETKEKRLAPGRTKNRGDVARRSADARTYD